MTDSSCLTAPGGYVRIPRAWLALDISPQAKAILLALCASADDNGASWHGYDQLGAMMHRSKAAIAGYIAELRDAGLITCHKQTYGNGYNYRLKIVLRDWAEHLRAWAEGARRTRAVSSEAKPAERRVRSAERKDPSGPINNPDQNKSRSAARSFSQRRDGDASPPAAPVAPRPIDAWSADDERAWRSFRPDDTAPLSAVAGRPAADLDNRLRRAIARLEAHVAEPDAETCSNALRARLDAAGVRGSRSEWSDAGGALARHTASGHALSRLVDAVAAIWKPHWRRPPTARQIDALVATLDGAPGMADQRDNRALLARLRNRLWLLDLHRGRSRTAA